ncbi:reverse transcriptase [Tanacetum coccineum]|uniref:Reverse transcriptase n=1 Tax=Tanacetum coccineum TaxID=301880 RepID=A0ABQ5CK82_9ASTR
MLVLSGNCQGVGRPLTVLNLRELCRVHRSDVVFLMEMKNKERYLESLRCSLPFTGFFYVNPIGRSGGLALWWKDNITLNIANGNKNIILVDGICLAPSVSWRACFIYGPHDRRDRKLLWQKISHLALSATYPFFVIGLNYTWDNNRAENANIWERIDQALANESLLVTFPSQTLTHCPILRSDHALLLYNTCPTHKKRQKGFRFESMWMLESSCEETVLNTWSDSSSSNVIADLEQNLAHCAKNLTSWSRKHFQNNRKVIEELTNELRLVQSATPMAANNARQRLLGKKLEETWRKKEMFWHQCLRVNWIKFGDQNTHFFHLSMIHKSQRNAITMLRNGEGQWVDDPVTLNTLIRNHFMSIYTSVGVREFGNVLDVIKLVVTEHMNASLEDTVADYEIVRAVKQLGAYKSPGKDGFPAFYLLTDVSSPRSFLIKLVTFRRRGLMLSLYLLTDVTYLQVFNCFIGEPPPLIPIPFTNFFMAILKYFRVHISQLSPFGAAWVSHFEVLTRVLDLAPSVTVFRAFYTRSYSDGLFSFAKRSTSAPSCFPKPPDSIKNWADHFFWVDSYVFLISVPLYTGGALEKDLAPHLTARQEQTVKLLESHKAPFRRYSECFLCLVGLSPYYPFDENSYPAFEHPDGSEIGLFDFIKTADPRNVQAVEVQKGDNQVSAPAREGQEDAAPEDAYLDLANPNESMAAVRQGEEEVVTKQPEKVKKKRLLKQGDVLPVKRLRKDHPTFVSGTGGKTLSSLEQFRPVGSHLPERTCTTVGSSSTLNIPVDAAAATTTSTRAPTPTKFATDANSNLASPSQPKESEGLDDSFYEPLTLDPFEAKRWYVLKWNVSNDSLLDDGFSCHTLVDRVAPPAFFSALRTLDYDQLYTEFNVGPARQVCLGAEVRSRTEHELELKEKLKAKYTARGRLLEEKDLEILKLKSQLAEREVEAAEVICLRDQVSSLSREKSALTAEVSTLNVTATQKDHDISLLNSRATSLASSLDDAKVACAEAGNKITSLAAERNGIASENGDSAGRAGLGVVQPCGRARGTRNGCLQPSGGRTLSYLLDYFGRKEMALTHGIQLALLKCLKSLEYQGLLGHALGCAVDFGIQEGLEAGYKHGVARRDLSAVKAYNPEVVKASYIDAVKALEDVDFSLVDLLKSKNDTGMDEVLYCFLLDEPLAGLSKAAYLQPCIEQLSVPIHHAGDMTAAEETSLSFALMNVHAHAEGAKKHAAALRQLMMEIVSAPLSSQTWVGKASTSVAPLHVEDYDEEDTDKALGSVVAIPKLETYRF